ncbi:MAG: ferrochelatase [Patescibacteria group bacterium]
MKNLVMNTKPVVLLMAYGTPQSLDEVEEYYVDIRRGKRPSPELVRELQSRYMAIGGNTPLLEITREQAKKLARATGLKTYVGMKHWHPFIKEAVECMKADACTRVIALVLAPHFSAMSTGGYIQRFESACTEMGFDPDVTFIERWGANRIFITSVVERIKEALIQFESQDVSKIMVVFTAHSLPEKITSADDSYKRELLETSQLVVDSLRLPHWQFSFQSAGRTNDPWLGPDIVESLVSIRDSGFAKVLVVPIGFVTDNLEILYDLDIEAKTKARQLGLEFYRTQSANATPRFIEVLADVIASAY